MYELSELIERAYGSPGGLFVVFAMATLALAGGRRAQRRR